MQHSGTVGLPSAVTKGGVYLSAKRQRIQSLDLVRGVAMILMAPSFALP
jgi:uncharacterized membrane protein